MVIKLQTKPLDKDPYTDLIPLSHKPYPNNSFVGYIIYNNELVAMARIYSDKNSNLGELGDVIVMDKFRGKKSPNNTKWSNLLMSKIIKAAKRRNITKIWLWTTQDNIRAVKLYKKFKFAETPMPNHLTKKIHKQYKWALNKILIRMERT